MKRLLLSATPATGTGIAQDPARSWGATSPALAKSLMYRADIDGLRALAIIAVVLFHAYPSAAPGGFVGVDVFFAISGFLITRIILDELDAGHFSLVRFYGRRARRIFPALSLVLLACLIFGWIALLPHEWVQLGRHIQAGAWFYSNWGYLKESGYFGGEAGLKPLLHLWSLAIEEQFYLVWPFIMMLVVRMTRAKAAALISAICIASFVYNVLETDENPAAAFYLPWGRIWELGTGALLSASVRSFNYIVPAYWQSALGVVGLAFIVTFYAFGPMGASFPGYAVLLPVLGAALLLASPDGIASRTILASRPAVYFGKISYPFYLWHWPLLSFPLIVNGRPGPFEPLVSVLISVMLASLTYSYVERPARRGGRATVAALVLVVGMLGVVGVCMRAQLFRPFAQEAAIGLEVQGPSIAPPVQNPNYSRDLVAKQVFEPDFKPSRDFFSGDFHSQASTVAVVGDSHAHSLYLGLSALGRSAVNVGRGTCLPFPGVEVHDLQGRSLKCQPAMGRALEVVAAMPSIQDVVLTGFFSNYLDGRVRLLGAGLSVNATSIDVFEHGLDEAATFLLGAGKRVFIVLDPPEVPFQMSECASRPFHVTPSRPDCSFDAAQNATVVSWRMAIDKVAAKHPGVVVADTWLQICPSGKCHARVGNAFLYNRDGHHLSILGATTAARALLGSSF